LRIADIREQQAKVSFGILVILVGAHAFYSTIELPSHRLLVVLTTGYKDAGLPLESKLLKRRRHKFVHCRFVRLLMQSEQMINVASHRQRIVRMANGNIQESRRATSSRSVTPASDFRIIWSGEI
jgi:hypothetical protein